MIQRLQAWSDTRIPPIVSVFAFYQHGVSLFQRHSQNLGGRQLKGSDSDPTLAGGCTIDLEWLA